MSKDFNEDERSWQLKRRKKVLDDIYSAPHRGQNAKKKTRFGVTKPKHKDHRR